MGLMRIFIAAAVVSVLLTQASYAQFGAPPTPRVPLTDEEKAEIARKKAAAKATDEAYEAMTKHTPDTKQKVDPWGGVRTPSTSGNK